MIRIPFFWLQVPSPPVKALAGIFFYLTRCKILLKWLYSITMDVGTGDLLSPTIWHQSCSEKVLLVGRAFGSW